MTPTNAHLALCAADLTAYAQAAFLILNPGTTFHEALYIRAMCNQLERIEPRRVVGHQDRVEHLIPQSGQSRCRSNLFLQKHFRRTVAGKGLGEPAACAMRCRNV